jgi:hypothetical protein
LLKKGSDYEFHVTVVELIELREARGFDPWATVARVMKRQNRSAAS